MRVLAYARVSSRDQALGTSLQDQQDALAAYARTRGLSVSAFYVEAESAVYEKQERREKVRQLLGELRSGDLVLCDKLDRWSRDPEFTYRTMREVREAGARVYFVGEQIDPTTPEGDSMLNMRVLMAREEHKRIRLRTVGTRKLLRNQGLYAEGAVPLGYRRQLPRGARGIEKNVLQVVDDAASVVVALFELAARGSSLSDLLDEARELWTGKGWDRLTINRMLRNRLYLGEVKDARGVWVPGKQRAIVNARLFDRVQRGLTERQKGGPRVREDSVTRDWLLRGHVWCALCDARMGSAYSGGAARKYEHLYYKCRGGCGTVPQPAADEAAGELLLIRLGELKDELSRAPVRRPDPPADLGRRRQRLEARRDRLLEQNLDGHISREELAARMAKLDQERTRIDAEEAATARVTPEHDLAARRALLKTVKGLRAAWGAMMPAERRDTVRDLSRRVLLAREAPPRVEWLGQSELELSVS